MKKSKISDLSDVGNKTYLLLFLCSLMDRPVVWVPYVEVLSSDVNKIFYVTSKSCAKIWKNIPCFCNERLKVKNWSPYCPLLDSDTDDTSPLGRMPQVLLSTSIPGGSRKSTCRHWFRRVALVPFFPKLLSSHSGTLVPCGPARSHQSFAFMRFHYLTMVSSVPWGPTVSLWSGSMRFQILTMVSWFPEASLCHIWALVPLGSITSQ